MTQFMPDFTYPIDQEVKALTYAAILDRGASDADRAGVGYRGGVGTEIAGASVPPSTWKIFPVTQEEAGEAR